MIPGIGEHGVALVATASSGWREKPHRVRVVGRVRRINCGKVHGLSTAYSNVWMKLVRVEVDGEVRDLAIERFMEGR